MLHRHSPRNNRVLAEKRNTEQSNEVKPNVLLAVKVSGTLRNEPQEPALNEVKQKEILVSDMLHETPFLLTRYMYKYTST